MPAVESITISGFKSIKHIEISLRPINALIGANGSGKSNFIQAFQLLHAIREGQLREYVGRSGGASRLLHFGPQSTDRIGLATSFNGNTNGYQIELQFAADDTLIPSKESLSYWHSDKYKHPMSHPLHPTGQEASISSMIAGKPSKIAAYVQQHLSKWKTYHFHDTSATSPMKMNADLNDNRQLRPDGRNLAPFLFLLKQMFPNHYQQIRQTVQLVAPFFDDFRIEPLNLTPSLTRIEWKHRKSDAYFDASSLSDGSLRFIALATLLLQPFHLRPSVIIIDEPELGLHPYAINVLASMIKQASHQTQIIIATQSPLLLDHLEPEDVLVADYIDGSTQLTRVDPARLSDWLQEYSLGQLWEKNELGGRPRPA